MKAAYQDPSIIEGILKNAHNIAVVGISDNPQRPSHDVAAFLQRKGYRIIPVNPKIDNVLGEKAYPNLSAVPEQIDVVDIFRRSEDVGPIIDEAIGTGAGAVWLQLGVINEEAADRAAEAGLRVVMDRCLKQEHQKIYG
jgi:predicted CoA-binding protein